MVYVWFQLGNKYRKAKKDPRLEEEGSPQCAENEEGSAITAKRRVDGRNEGTNYQNLHAVIGYGEQDENNGRRREDRI